jgi:hypothetical protein
MFYRSAHAVARPTTESGFEGVPAPAYNGSIPDVKGKQKETDVTAKPSVPRRKVEIKSKKAAITMVSISLSYNQCNPSLMDRHQQLLIA